MDNITRDHFSAAADLYSKRSGIVHEIDSLIIDRLRKRNLGSVLEIGGGSGYMLDLILRQTGVREVVNCEFVPAVYNPQINKAIHLIGGDGRCLPIKDHTIDAVIMKNVLHHVIGVTRKESVGFSHEIFREVHRVTKEGGEFYLLEQYVPSRMRSLVVFHALKIFSMIKIRNKVIDSRKYPVVSFLTPPEIMALFAEHGIGITGTKRIGMNEENLLFRILLRNAGRLYVTGETGDIREELA